MGDMSEDQERALEQFKKYIKDNNITEHPQYDDYYLLRFLRARKFEMEKVILMFNTFMEWRKENDVDNILEVIQLPSFTRINLPLHTCCYRCSTLKSMTKSRLYTLTSTTKPTRRVAPSTSSASANLKSTRSSRSQLRSA